MLNKETMKYFDKYQFLHDNAEATCGNKILYTSMFNELDGYSTNKWINLTIKMDQLVLEKSDKITTIRDIGNSNPDSLDNIIAFIYADILTADDFQRSGWYFNGYDKNAHTWKECFKQLWKYRKEMKADRNYHWENGLDAVGKLTNLISPHIQYYAKKKADKFSLHLAPFFYLWLISVFMKRNYKNGEKQTGAISQKNICFLILSDLGSLCWIKLFNHKKNMRDYFSDENHPIVRYLSNK